MPQCLWFNWVGWTEKMKVWDHEGTCREMTCCRVVSCRVVKYTTRALMIPHASLCLSRQI